MGNKSNQRIWRMKKFLAVTVAASALAFCSSSALAVTYNLNIDNCTGGCAGGASPPFATVDVTAVGGNLDFTVTLLDGLQFNKSTGLTAFVFGFSDKVASVTNIVDNGPGTFTSVTGPLMQDGFATFKQGITNTATGGTVLSFEVLNETIANLIGSTGAGQFSGSLFSADVVGLNGNTGPIGGGVVAGVPEPATWGMMLLGFLGLGFAFRQSRRKVSFA
jgi:hypothetical protein